MKYTDILKKESDFKLTEFLYIQSNLIILIDLVGNTACNIFYVKFDKGIMSNCTLLYTRATIWAAPEMLQQL